jgi:hypothetical protein
MKKNTLIIVVTLILVELMLFSCKKNKKSPSEPPMIPLPPEVITTLRIYIWDSLTNVAVTGSPFTFKDPDGEGGQPGAFLNNGADSLIRLTANTVYKTQVVILDETSNPTDSVSKAVGGEDSYEHMFFYNGNPVNQNNNSGNTVLNSVPPNYSLQLNGSNILIRYTDTDNGAQHNQPTRSIGLKTILKTAATTGGAAFPFILTLRHQPEAKDGTYAPGETDIEVGFKIKVQ